MYGTWQQKTAPRYQQTVIKGRIPLSRDQPVAFGFLLILDHFEMSPTDCE
jgi:hypothetical protein